MESYLVHHGIKGQRWGIRRYQNEDGTLTEAGRKRELRQEARTIRKERRFDARNASALSKEELESRIQRLAQEDQLRTLTKRNQDAGRQAVGDAMKSVGTRIATTALSGAALYALSAWVGGNFSKQGMASAIFNGGAKKK